MPKLKERIYALQVKPGDIEFVKFLYDPPLPEIKRPYKTWLVISVAEDGESITTELMTENEMWDTYDLTKRTPLLIRLKRNKGD